MVSVLTYVFVIGELTPVGFFPHPAASIPPPTWKPLIHITVHKSGHWNLYDSASAALENLAKCRFKQSGKKEREKKKKRNAIISLGKERDVNEERGIQTYLPALKPWQRTDYVFFDSGVGDKGISEASADIFISHLLNIKITWYFPCKLGPSLNLHLDHFTFCSPWFW